MNERPILFSGEMTKAILDGRKRQTRRVIKPQPVSDFWVGSHLAELFAMCQYGQIRSRLWLRETLAAIDNPYGGLSYGYYADGKPIQPLRDWEKLSTQLIPAIFMPRWASRIMLQITELRVEKLNDISLDDVIAEGIGSFTFARGALSDNPPNPRWKFIELWDSINSKRGYGWESNPWVWVIEFIRLENGL